MPLTPQQRIWRDRAESAIGLAAPWLDLMLNVGDRVSRLLSPNDADYYPIRPAGETFELNSEREGSEGRPATDTVD